MSAHSHIAELRNRHQVLEEQIAQEAKRPSPDEEKIGEMKRRKLQIKDQIERLQAKSD